MKMRMRMLPNLLPVATCRLSPGEIEPRPSQTACEPASRGEGGVVNYDVVFAIGDSSHPQYLAKRDVS